MRQLKKLPIPPVLNENADSWLQEYLADLESKTKKYRYRHREIKQALRDGPYGRCVYACDNDVVDRQVVNMEFEGGATVSFTMAGFTVAQGRETWIMGTRGQLRSGGRRILEHTDFLTDQVRDLGVDESGDPALATGHAGDATVILNFIEAIAENRPDLLLTSPEVSLESHLMAFAAERARKTNTVQDICL